MNTGCLFDSSAPITVEPWVHFGPGVSLVTSTHTLGPHGQRAGELIAKPIHIGAGCWIGARAVILPGVTIAPGTVIAAGAVVTSDCEADRVYAGVPAREVRILD